jgi:DNA-directed RNA polymerase subunit RPC12/RpoP
MARLYELICFDCSRLIPFYDIRKSDTMFGPESIYMDKEAQCKYCFRVWKVYELLSDSPELKKGWPYDKPKYNNKS